MWGSWNQWYSILLAQKLRDVKSFQTERTILGNVYIDQLLKTCLGGILFEMASG
ncbi:MAG: hypothetical protein LBF42_02775 [Puniceicoccales bacterium]|nr:hypothetical protein [Puniceicoccales bacterium]